MLNQGSNYNTVFWFLRLRDESGHVRKNTLMVLTHLILNDMVKVKGQISEMATCLEDKDSRISDLAKLFFLELSKKVRKYVTSSLIDSTVKPRFNEPRFNEVPDLTHNFIQPGQNYNKMYGKEPRFNEILDITNTI